MSALRAAEFSGDVATLHQAIDHQRLPSKRKLDDCCPLDPFDPTTILDHHLPSLDADDARVSSLPAAAAASSSSSDSLSTLQFFVRTMSGTLVMHASPNDTVNFVIKKIKTMTGMSSLETRLIYRGRQLQEHCTLSECSIEKDSSINLTGRLRSTKFPNAWQIANELIASICWLGDPNADGANLHARRHAKSDVTECLIKKFLSSTPPIHSGGGSSDDTWGHLEVFTLACAPTALVRLYLSPVSNNRKTAEKFIRYFLVPNYEYLSKSIQILCIPIVLEFCNLIAGTAGRRDSLYLSCRNTLSSLVMLKDSRYFAHSKPRALISDMLPFVFELSETLIAGLSLDTMFVLPEDLVDFCNFVRALRRAIRSWVGRVGSVSEIMNSRTHPRCEEWIAALRGLFIRLLSKADDCLGKVEVFLAEKGPAEAESHWGRWAHLLVILTGLNCISKLYKDGGELMHSVLEAHRVCLNALVVRAKRSDRLRWLLKHKDITDFEARQNLVMMMFPEGKDEYDDMHEMLIERTQLLTQSFNYFEQAEASALHGAIFVEFKDEEATGPGVLREWFCMVCQALFDPQKVLFVPCPNDRRRFFPNHASPVDSLHLEYFSFCGRVIALALRHKVQVGIVLDRVLFSQLAGRSITLEDVQDADPHLYMSCKKILEMDANILDLDILGLTFIREIEELGAQRTVELCPGGKDIVVNSKNRAEYVDLLIEHHFVTSISEQVSHFTRGFGEMLANPKHQKLFFQSLDLKDFDKMLGGSDSLINVSDWKEHTEYDGYRKKDRQIDWFWKIVEGMAEEKRRALLFFWTSLRYLPVNGFGGLESKLYISKNSDCQDRLPSSHTCFFRLCLPKYPSKSVMRDRLHLITQEHVSCSFGTW